MVLWFVGVCRDRMLVPNLANRVMMLTARQLLPAGWVERAMGHNLSMLFQLCTAYLHRHGLINDSLQKQASCI